MKVMIDVKPYQLDDTDTIGGISAKALVAFAATVRKAGITDDDLKQFMKDADRIAEIVRAEYDGVMRQAVDSLFRPDKPWDA